MPRLIILLLIVLVMAAVAVQNPGSLSLVVLGGFRTPEIPLGLILVAGAALGSLITLILYGLVGARRPPESKYRPMGQRVPYPNSPGSTTLPPSGPAYQPVEKPYSSTSTAAFVSEPSRPPDSSSEASVSDPVEPIAEPESAPEPRAAISNPFAQKKKNKNQRKDSVEDKKIGDNWGDLRTAEQLNSWEAIGESNKGSGRDAGKKPGLFDSIATGIGLGSGLPQSSGQMADDIAAGWDENSAQADRDGAHSYYSSDSYRADGYDLEGYEEGYEDDLDSGWENSDSYGSSPPAMGSQERPQKRVYNDGLYGDEGPYLDADSDEEIGSDGVYEADYRVIEPPSKPLDNTAKGHSEDDGDYHSS